MENNWVITDSSPINASNPAPEWSFFQFDTRRFMRRWCDTLMQRTDGLRWRGGHDEGIYTRTLPSFYLLTGYENARNVSLRLADDFINADYAEACTCFLTSEDAAEFGDRNRGPKYHGYQADQSCLVHGPENYCWFLAHLAYISDDPKYAEALRDTAEHIGNFSDDSPPWYDWEEHRFRSALLATKRVRDYPPYDYETLTHVRVMVIATNTFALTGDERYLDLAVNWCDKWSEIVLSSEDGFPVHLYQVPNEKVKELYGEFAHFNKTSAHSELANLFLDLHRLRPNDRYAEAARKMIDAVLEKEDLMMGCLVSKYRTFTGDKSFDERIINLAEPDTKKDDETPAILLMRRPPRHLSFNDVDYVTVDNEGSVKQDKRSVSMLLAAYQITGDVKYAQSALNVASGRVSSSWYLWDGREFGCQGSSNARNAVAMKNAIPAIGLSTAGGFGMLEGEIPWFQVHYRQPDGTFGLPENVMVLYRERPEGGKEIRFVNENDDPKTIYIQCRKPGIAVPKFDPQSSEWSKLELPGKTMGMAEREN